VSGLWGLVQARMASTRLPGKVMMDLAGRPLIWHIVDRMRRVPGLKGIVIATTTDRRNDRLDGFAKDEGLAVYRHAEEDDIAGRLAGAVRSVDAEAVMKLNGDCPVVDPAVLTRLVRRFESDADLDYVSNKVVWTYPAGLSAEVIGRDAILWCDANVTSPLAREYISDWIRDHTERFLVASVEYDEDLSRFGWTVDTPEDFAFMESLFRGLYREGKSFSLADVLAFLSKDRVRESVRQ